MALNCVMVDGDGIPVPLPHEMAIMNVKCGSEISLKIPDAPPTSASTAGGSGGMKELKSSGEIYLTDQRLIFLSKSDVPTKKSGPSASRSEPPAKRSEPSAKKSDSPASQFESLSVPLRAVLSTRFEQPILGANYLSFEVKPTPEGHLTDGTHVQLRFHNKPMFEFVSLLEKSRERAIYMKRQMADDEEGLPSYTTPAESSTVSIVDGIPIDNPPSYD